MTVRLIVSDIDGTLVRDDKTLSDAVAAAVGRVREAGIGFSLISARPPSGMLWIAERLRLTDPIGAFNGGTILDPDGHVRSADYLSDADVDRVLALLDRPGIEPWLFRDGRWHATTLDNPHVARERLAANVEPVIVTDMAALREKVDKLVGVSADHELLRRVEREVADALGDRATVARSQPYYLDVTARTGNKGDGVVALAGAVGVPLSAVAVLGDQYNDLAMFARAGRSYAMGQGPEDVRAKATRVVASNEDDGVVEAIDLILDGNGR